MTTLSDIDKQKIDLWTAHDMTFVLSREKGIGTIPQFTPCVKPPYTKKIRGYLDKMEESGFGRSDGRPKAVAVKLEGMLRYVWRTDVLTREEYDVHRKKKLTSLGALRQKPGGTVGEGGTD